MPRVSSTIHPQVKVLYDAAMRRKALLLVGLGLAGCGGASTLPIDLEVKDGAAVPNGKWDEIQLVVKALPGAEVQFNGQTKNMDATRAIEQFSVPKSTLKLGKNSFVVRAKTGALFSKREGEKTIEWDAQPKVLLRFHGSSKGDSEALTCAGALCGQASLKVTKAGRLPLEVESAIAGTVTMGGAKADVAAGRLGTLDVDLLALVAARSVGELSQIGIPFTFEANGVKGEDVLELGGTALSDFAARAFAQVEQAPLTFAGETAPKDAKRALLVVVGAPARKFIVVGNQGKFSDVDLVGVAKKSERTFACGPETEILYNDLEIRVVDRRTAKTVGNKKLLADRVSCPPTPAGKLTGEVREDDVKKVLGEFLTK
jgi:hypothetical protein